MKVLITGITGMAGSHLAEYISANTGAELFGIARWRSPLNNLRSLVGKVRLVEADIRDCKSITSAIAQVKPDKVFHLAAQSYVVASFNAPRETLETNIIGTLNLLEAIRAHVPDCVVHVASSGEVYGQVSADEVPITETNELRTPSPYAVGKVGEDMIAYQFACSYGLKVLRSRAFTHTGPRRGPVFAESSFAKQIAEAEMGLREPIVRVGNLNSSRTFADVRDMVRAYWLLSELGVPGEVYNIGGVETLSMRQTLEYLIGLSSMKLGVEVEASRLRPADVVTQVPCIDKFQNLTGWVPTIPIRQTFSDLLNYWRRELRSDDAFHNTHSFW